MKNILKKLHTIQSEVGHMEKDGKNTFQNYKYLSETQVTLTMKKLLDKHEVVFIHSSEIINLTEATPTKQGTKQFITNLKVVYRFYDIESGEFVEGHVAGQGEDTGDKGVYKAITGAIKYIFMKNFMIPTGDDPEKTSDKPQAQSEETFIPDDRGNLDIGKIVCNDCSSPILTKDGAEDTKVIEYSKSKYNVPVCWECQQKRKSNG